MANVKKRRASMVEDSPMLLVRSLRLGRKRG